MPRGRVIVGRGQATNPRDADQVGIDVGIRDGNVVTISAANIRSGTISFSDGGTREVWFTSGAEARALSDDTFGGCETARNTALVLHRIFIGRTIEQGLAVSESEVRAVLTTGLEEDRGCVGTVIAAVRKALLDAQITVLAEAVVNVRGQRITSP